MRQFLAAGVAVSLSMGLVFADDPKSGPEVGKPAPGFEMQVATGDDAGKPVDYLKKWEKKPVLLILVGEMTRPGFALLRQLDKYGRLRQPEGLEVLIVRVTDDAEAAVRHSKLLYDNYDVKSPAGVVRQGKAGPPDYGIHEEAQITVLVLDKEHKVAHNLVRRSPERKDFEEVRKGIDKLLGPSSVPFP